MNAKEVELVFMAGVAAATEAMGQRLPGFAEAGEEAEELLDRAETLLEAAPMQTLSIALVKAIAKRNRIVMLWPMRKVNRA